MSWSVGDAVPLNAPANSFTIRSLAKSNHIISVFHASLVALFTRLFSVCDLVCPFNSLYAFSTSFISWAVVHALDCDPPCIVDLFRVCINDFLFAYVYELKVGSFSAAAAMS
jgi:hypothetical protein